jgi:soluble lytic murein transglycosylase
MKSAFRSSPPNRGSSSLLSSVPTRIVPALLLIGTALLTSPALADANFPAYQGPRSDSVLSSTIAQWKSLQQSDSYSFATYASFLISNPGWPGEAALRKSAERMVQSDVDSPSLVINYFRRYPPLTAAGQLRFAEALYAQGVREEARSAARKAWTSGPLTSEEEARFLGRFSDALQPGDQDARMDRLLWSRATTAAARQLPYTSLSKRTLFDARLALLTKAPDALAKSTAVDEIGRNDAGYLADKALWLNNSMQWAGARALLSATRTLVAPPTDPAKWLEVLFVNAKAAANDQQWSLAYNIARQLDDVYPPGTVVRDKPLEERDNFTSLAWLAGSTALNKLGRPADAVRMFDLYANAARTAQTRSKGWYWAGRAAESAGQRELAIQHYTAAAEFVDQFHGQLASERLGRPLVRPVSTGTLAISAAERDSFERSPIVRAVVMLGQQGNWQDQTRFVRTIAANAKGPVEQALAAELGKRINRLDLSLLVGKSARDSNNPDYFAAAFPQLSVPSEHSGSWTMIHAITRQESQFDREAISPVGARGLMQLMPGTARQTAPSAGVSYDFSALTQNPEYNMRLGSTYFGQMMDLYGGSYVLAVAAYNAGPGNVNKWLRANGDPRLPGADVLNWIEAIPLTETRNYVQRVLENAVVYDLINPRGASIRSRTPLSAYLGKRQPG